MTARSALLLLPLLASAQTYTVHLDKNVTIQMRDGVRLSTNIYRPARDGAPAPGRFPVIMERTPYGKLRAQPLADYYVPKGYVVIVQDVRGRYESEGRWIPIKNDPNDGFDTVKWIAGQPWSDGNIGTAGTSYGGATQHALAISNPPNLKTMIPVDAMSNFGRYGMRHNGAFELRWFNWVATLGNSTVTQSAAAASLRAAVDPAAAPALVDMGTRVREYVRGLPFRSGTTALQHAPDYEKWLIEAMSHGDYDDFWKSHGASVVDQLAVYKDIPIYHITGWYDSWGNSVANLNYIELKRTKKSQQRLIIGPWTHGGQGLSNAGDAQFTPDAALAFNDWRLRWYDRWLKGIENGVDKEAPVKLYIMGGGGGHKTPEGRLMVGGHWRDEQEWPLARTAYTPYYAHANGTLSKTTPQQEPPVSFTFDPRNPVPTLGGNVSSFGTLGMMGATDQRCTPAIWLCADSRPLAARNDVLVFQTPPLDAPVEVTGRLIVKLWASTDGPDTDFTAKLVDVYPPNKDYPAGVDLIVADSIVRGRYRNGSGKAALLQPNHPYEFTIEMYPTSLVFQKGHRLRLDISSSNFPRFDVNPNTGEPLNNNRRWRIAQNTIYMDAQRPTRIVLPIIPR